MLRRLKVVLFSLLPTIAFLGCAELAARLFVGHGPDLVSAPLVGEDAGLFRSDSDLFWSLQPDLALRSQNVWIRTNALGLRGPEIQPKAPGELRILSLGESTTFGAGVENGETYTALLPKFLNSQLPNRTVTAINAGVSAYSSFQSLKYLELRGLALEPDLVLFYHELNDYLPSTLRDSRQTEIGVMRTDKELYESRLRRIHAALIDNSALYQWAAQKLVLRRIQSFDRDEFDNPLLSIGLPDIALPPRLRERVGDTFARIEADETSLGRRVSEQERREVLEQLSSLCRERGIQLVVIHPSYRRSERHGCLLTEFCRAHDVPMFEAFDILHPASGRPLYWDAWHPTREGHRRLARALARFIAARSDQ